MLIRYWMSTPAIHIGPQNSMQDAISLMKEKNVHQLPVLDGKGKLVGIISDRDLKRASASDATTLEVHELLYLISKISVRDIMTKTVVTAHPDWTIEEAASLMLGNKISGLPVLNDDGDIRGFFSKTDLFKATLYITGLRKKGVHLAFTLEDTPGSIMDVVSVIREFGGRMVSILSTYDRAPEGYRNVYLRFTEVPRDRMEELITILKNKARLRYLVDHRKNKRILYQTP